MTNYQSLFTTTHSKDSFLRPLGAGIAMAIPLLLAILLGDSQIASLGVMGAFAYLAFQYKSICYNVKAICLHGIVLFASLSLGLSSGLMPWTIPLVISVISFSGYLLTKIYRIPKPDIFFVIMLYATGTNFPPTPEIFQTSGYLLFGVVGSLLSGVLISFIEKLPFTQEPSDYGRLSFRDKYYLTIYQEPTVLIKAMHFAMILFISAYLSYLLQAQSGYWILISSAAVLAGEQLDKIRERFIQRVLGSVIGLLLGSLLIGFQLPLIVNFGLLIILNILVEYFMPRNYGIANFFTNPQVLLLSSIAAGSPALGMVPYRFSGVLIGSALALILMSIVDYGMSLVKEKF
ncbi:FUSC family protein [Vagococcus sp. BWB3-3]|uniref:FUSC family protein n=1 Tax=Vagococcus allomyrinae TaxID=2794353 RepID=A0A940SWQ6_9ENTE|nr:FUSC family protein [Vagococcus allomyrinae]MBP1043530.1 FUSC family protein [Vagococcus allomyrinae]